MADNALLELLPQTTWSTPSRPSARPSTSSPLTPDQSVWPTHKVVGNWVEMNRCATEPEVTEMPDLADDGTRITREVYSACQGDGEVVLYVVHGAGHTWPGGLQYQPEQMIGKTSQDMDASQVIWEFFERHPMPQDG